MNQEELYAQYYLNTVAQLCGGDQQKVAYVLQTKQAEMAKLPDPTAYSTRSVENDPMLQDEPTNWGPGSKDWAKYQPIPVGIAAPVQPGMLDLLKGKWDGLSQTDKESIYSALAGAGIGGIGALALSKKNKLRNTLLGLLGGAGVGYAGKSLYDRLTAEGASPGNTKGENLANFMQGTTTQARNNKAQGDKTFTALSGLPSKAQGSIDALQAAAKERDQQAKDKTVNDLKILSGKNKQKENEAAALRDFTSKLTPIVMKGGFKNPEALQRNMEAILGWVQRKNVIQTDPQGFLKFLQENPTDIVLKDWSK